MKVNMRSTVALTLAALAFVPAIATYDTSPKELHVTEVDTFTVDCDDEAPRPTVSVETFFSTREHHSVKYTLSGFTSTEIGGVTVPYPTKAVEHHTIAVIDYSPSEEQSVVSVTSTCDEEEPAVTPNVSTFTEEQPAVTSSASIFTEEQPIPSATSTSVEEQPVVSSTASASSTQEQPTIVFVPTYNVSIPVVVFTSSADAHSEASTQPAPVTSAEQVATTEAIVPPVATTETPLINPIRPSFTPSDTPITTSITLTTTETLPGASIPPVKEGVSHVGSSPVAGSISTTSTDLSYTTKTMTKSHTAMVTVILNPTHISPASEASAESCLSTTYVTVYSPPASIVPVATAPSAIPPVVQNTTAVATGVPRPNNNTTTVQTPPIHGAAPTLSGAPGLMLAFCGLICYLI
ncbi:hypothetical protein V497_04565 [Pseudogymnoascus sp. VKM F-4516 (FW-969)]|nr:hypothetical protein V497_04565 [Pseudogymnoascus sp. VKM F-4516 (FW-969)]